MTGLHGGKNGVNDNVCAQVPLRFVQLVVHKQLVYAVHRAPHEMSFARSRSEMVSIYFSQPVYSDCQETSAASNRDHKVIQVDELSLLSLKQSKVTGQQRLL